MKLDFMMKILLRLEIRFLKSISQHSIWYLKNNATNADLRVTIEASLSLKTRDLTEPHRKWCKRLMTTPSGRGCHESKRFLRGG